MANQLDAQQVRRPDAYEAVRTGARAELARVVSARRVRLGDGLTVGFVDHGTLRGVAEEQLRAERRDDDQAVIEVVERVNVLAQAGLVALLIVESDDAAEQAAALERLATAAPRVELVAGATHVAGSVVEDSGADPVVVLHFAPDEIAVLRGAEAVTLIVTLGERTLRAELDEGQRAAL